jgi:phospholipase/carboxylesterase
MTTTFGERPAAGEPDGLLILHHGRGSDENDLLGLADVLDPERRLHVVTPRAPLSLGGPGYHWYVVPRVGYPDHDTFHAAYQRLASFHDEVWERTGLKPEQTIFGGFSMGSVMSYSLGLGPDRPAPAGIMAFSGFIPTVEGWQPDVPRDTRVFIAHGRRDPIMEVGFAQRANALLESAGMDVEYHESDAAHHIDPAHVPAARAWVGATLRSGAPRPR